MHPEPSVNSRPRPACSLCKGSERVVRALLAEPVGHPVQIATVGVLDQPVIKKLDLANRLKADAREDRL